MISVTDRNVLAAIHRLAVGEVGLEQFEDEFISGTWERSSALVAAVTSILAESSGNVADDVAIRQLRSLAATNNVTLTRDDWVTIGVVPAMSSVTVNTTVSPTTPVGVGSHS